MDEMDIYDQSKQAFIEGDSLAKAGKRAEAIEAYSRGLALVPQGIYGLVKRGNIKIELDDVGGALADFEEAIAIDPTYGPAYYGRGWARGRLGDYTGELADARTGMELEPTNHGRYWRRIGSALSGLGRSDEALGAYARALESNPDDEGTLFNRALLLVQLKRYSEALTHFNRVLELDPDWDWALRERGVLLGKMGRWDEALADHTQLVALYPDDPTSHQLLAETKKGSEPAAPWWHRFVRRTGK